MSENRDTKGKSVRVVIDTGVWISFFIGKVLKRLGDYLKNESVVILFSDELFEELMEVLGRPKLREYIRESHILEIMGIVYYKADWVQIREKTDICRDKKDNFLLDLASNGNADYLVTGDQDLLVIGEFQGTRILSFKEFDTILSDVLSP